MSRSRSIHACAAGLLIAVGMCAPASAQAAPYVDCGDLFQGSFCLLFTDSVGREWLLDDYGNFQAGDHVLVAGVPDMTCPNTCGPITGCLLQNTIQTCLPNAGTTYCECDSAAPCGNIDNDGGGCENGTGTGGVLSAAGSNSVVFDNLMLTASELPPNEPGLFYMGPSQVGAIPFGDGQRCVGAAGGTIFRYPIRNSGITGTVTEGPIAGFANMTFPMGGEIDPGETWNFQYWYRDPNGPCGSSFNLTNAVSVDFVF